jgi:hypothetical protein
MGRGKRGPFWCFSDMELTMTSRTLMVGVIALIVGSILSILAVQYFSPNESANSTVPPDPLVVTPENAAKETN